MAENPFMRKVVEGDQQRAEANQNAKRQKAEQAKRHALGSKVLEHAQRDRSGTPLETFFAGDPESLQMMRYFAEAAKYAKYPGARTGVFRQGLIRAAWQGSTYLLGQAVVQNDAYDLRCQAVLFCDDERLRMTSEFNTTPDASLIGINYGVVPENIGLEPAYFVQHPPELDGNPRARRDPSYGFRAMTLDAILRLNLGIQGS